MEGGVGRHYPEGYPGGPVVSLGVGPGEPKEPGESAPRSHLDELVGQGAGDRTGVRRTTRLDVPAHGAKIEFGLGQILALPRRLQGHLVQLGAFPSWALRDRVPWRSGADARRVALC